MAEDSESIPQMEEGASNDVPEQSEIDVQLSKKSTTESCKFGTAVDSGVNIKKAGRSANSSEELRPLSAKEIKEINIILRDCSLLSRVPLPNHSQHYNPPRNVSDVVRELAQTTLLSSLRCSLMKFSMHEAMTVGKERRDKALQIAKVTKSNKAAIYRALAYNYDIAIKLATERIGELEVTAKSAERAAFAALSAVDQMTGVSDETSNAASLIMAVRRAGTAAHKENSLAGRTLYVSLMTMRGCWQDLDPERVDTDFLSTRNAEEHFKNKREKSSCLKASIILNSCIVFILIVNAKSRDIPLPYFSLRFAVEAIGVGLCLYKTVMICSEKLRVWKIEKKISSIDERLHVLGEVFGHHNALATTPRQLDMEINEPKP